MSDFWGKEFGLKNRRRDNIDPSGERMWHVGPSGAAEWRNNKYNDHKTGAIWAKDGTYLGSISKKRGLNSDLIRSLHKKYADKDNGFNSHNDIAGAIQAAYENREIDYGPVELSPEMQQAKDRVQQWESSVSSGQQSESIFGGGGASNESDPINEKSSAGDQTKKAAKAFIDRKNRDGQ